MCRGGLTELGEACRLEDRPCFLKDKLEEGEPMVNKRNADDRITPCPPQAANFPSTTSIFRISPSPFANEQSLSLLILIFNLSWPHRFCREIRQVIPTVLVCVSHRVVAEEPFPYNPRSAIGYDLYDGLDTKKLG